MRKLFFFFAVLSLFALDRYGERTIWDFEIKGVYMEKWNAELAAAARRFGFDTVVLRERPRNLSSFGGLRILQVVDIDEAKTTSPSEIYEMPALQLTSRDLIKEFSRKAKKREKTLRKIFAKGKKVILKVPFSRTASELFLKTGLLPFFLKLPGVFISERRGDFIPREKFIAWIEGSAGVEVKVLSLFKNGMAGFILKDFQSLSDEELLKIAKITNPKIKLRINLPDYLDVPMYYQETDYYCGPASVKMIIDYLMGEKLSQDFLAKQMGTKGPTAGTPPRRIMEFLRRYTGEPFSEYPGFSHSLIEKNIRYGFPVIARVKTSYLSGWKGAYGHYIVIKGFAGDFYYVNDPVKGKVFYTKKEIENAVVKHYFGPLLIVRLK